MIDPKTGKVIVDLLRPGAKIALDVGVAVGILIAGTRVAQTIGKVSTLAYAKAKNALSKKSANTKKPTKKPGRPKKVQTTATEKS
jgi:hypothetical protein